MFKNKPSLLIITFCLLLTSVYSQIADVFVNGYFKSDGSFVQPHYRTNPNGTLFDNYSTKGNYNPYTGKPGWIDPYTKISKTYYTVIPKAYRNDYDNLFKYLNDNDSIRYFNIVNHFDYYYKLFFTGLFKLNTNEIEDAHAIFKVLTKVKTNDEFINKESADYLELTANYLDATEDFKFIHSAFEYEKENNYSAVLEAVNKVKNPLNYFEKYLIKFTTEVKIHKYAEAKYSYDSLILYTSDPIDRDSFIKGREDVFYSFDRKINYLKALENNTYFYSIKDLLYSFNFYVRTNTVPILKLKKDYFSFMYEECSISDSVLTRSFIDTSVSRNSKFDALKFHKHLFNQTSDTLILLKQSFTDEPTFLFYQNFLSVNTHTRELSKSFVYKLENQTGQEYLANENVGIGLIRNNDKEQLPYEIYFFCIVNPEGIRILSSLFK